MKRKISGDALRDKFLARIQSDKALKPTEEARIEALSSSGNRELLGIIATKRPQSIGELATLAGRLQPNVSRSLNALARAGLLTVTHAGRASIPTLTSVGQRKATELEFAVQEIPFGLAPSSSDESPLLSMKIESLANGKFDTDDVPAEVVVRFPATNDHLLVEASAQVNLNEACTNLLANWWRVLHRRANPFRLFALKKTVDQHVSTAMLLIESTGKVTLSAHAQESDRTVWAGHRFSLSVDEFAKLALDELARPLVHHLRAKKRFDRPVESLLRRTEEILNNSADRTFWKCAGALGLSYQTIDDSGADEVAALIAAVSNEDARLDFASAVSPGQLHQSLKWVSDEVTEKAKANCLPRLIELRQITLGGSSTGKPYLIGTERARNVRDKIGLAPDRAVGGISGLAQIFGGKDTFIVSAAGDEPIRGFLGHGDDVPVVVVRQEGPRNTTFLASRAIGDYLVYGSREAPIMDIYSDRQAVGRAFAAEFMAPASGVIHMIDEEGEPVSSVAAHYGVPREVILHQYENNVAQYARP
jgi:hypothetical protein